MTAALFDHAASGTTTLCRAWHVRRRDGVSYGFTDHDGDLEWEGQRFAANTGLTARALQQTTGLSVDNSEAIGALSDAALTEADVAAGRFDGAEISLWLVNWADPAQRLLQFRGQLGEMTRAGGAFRAELRGLTDQLNQMTGRVFQRGCAAVLGDRRCRFDLTAPGFRVEVRLLGQDGLGRLQVAGAADSAPGWFEGGRLRVMDGAAAGLEAVIRQDLAQGGGRVLDLWQALPVQPLAGARLLLEAGCDRGAETCRTKFGNFLNFQGFPHIPGEDWLASYPVASRPNDGGSLAR